MANEKLDSLSKILVATSAINYMANTLYSANQQMKYVVGLHPEEGKAHVDGITHRDEVLSQAVKGLAEIMEELGNCMNEHDCISPIDVRITKEAFSIILKGQDNVEEEIVRTPPMLVALSVAGKPEVKCKGCGNEEETNKSYIFSATPNGDGRMAEQLEYCKKCGRLIQSCSLQFRDTEQEKEQIEAFTKAGIRFTVK